MCVYVRVQVGGAKSFELRLFPPLVFSDDAGIQAYPPAEKAAHRLPPE